VKFKKGAPSHVTDLSEPTLWVYVLNAAGETIREVRDGETSAEVYTIRFKNHHVRYIQKVVGYVPDFDHLGGVTPNSSIEEITRALGQPSTISHSSDETERIYSFDRYNVAFEFSRGRVSRMGVFDPKTGPLRYAKEAK
jgi:hypothetical protein